MKAIKLLFLLAIKGAQTFSTENQTFIINTTDIQFPSQSQILGGWAELITPVINATWEGCDKNESLIYCAEKVAKNETNSTETCLEEKGCCKGDSDTGFIPCPSLLSEAIYLVVIGISGILLLANWSRASGPGEITAGSLVTFCLSCAFLSTENLESWQKSLGNVAISIGSGITAGFAIASLRRWIENRCRTTPAEFSVSLIQEENSRRCC